MESSYLLVWVPIYWGQTAEGCTRDGKEKWGGGSKSDWWRVRSANWRESERKKKRSENRRNYGKMEQGKKERRARESVVWETACLGRSILRAAGGRVAQLIKTPVLMSQPVTPGRVRETGRGRERERGLPGWSSAAPQPAIKTANPASSQPTRPHVRQALTLCPSTPFILCSRHTHTHVQTPPTISFLLSTHPCPYPNAHPL